jgi:hypothetical protein
MACVNTNSPEYKALIKGMNVREKFVARAVISRFMTENNGEMPSFVELKSAISDLYNTNQGGIDYSGFYDNVKDLFKKLLPGLSNAEIDQRVQFIDKLELMRLRNGKEVLTSFIDNIVYVSKTLPSERGERAYNDIRHEIFHILFNNFLSDDEQQKMAESFKRWKPEFANIMDKEELEERMADAFEDYQASPKRTIPILIRDFFVDLLKFFGLVGDNYVSIKKLFSDVENGKFTRNYQRDSLVTRDKTILSKYTEFSTDLDLFLQAKAFVLNNMNELMNPEDNAQLTEVNNGNLFLNQNYQSPLFQNNKDVFKLGLTKNDALKQLQKRIKALKDSRTVDPQLAKVINVLSKNFILKDLFDYLQPYSTAKITAEGELVLEGHEEEDPTEELLEIDEDINSLEIGSKELINPITKISEVVKDFLSNITYETSPGNFVSIDPGAGFISLLNMMGSMYGNTSIEDNLDSLKAAYNETTKGNQTKAVYNKLRELHEALQSSDRIVLNIKGVSAQELADLRQSLDDNDIQHETFKDNMTIIVPANMKIENKGTNNVDNKVVFTFNRFKDGKQSYRIVQRDNESNKTYIESISRQTGIPSFVISKLFKYNEQRNQLAELTKVAGSLRKLSPKFVKVQTTRVNVDGFSQQTTSYAFINKVNEYKSSGSLASVIRDRFDIQDLRQEILTSVARYRTMKDRVSRLELRALLQDVLVNKFNAISISDFQRVSEKDVTNLLNSLDRIVSFTPDLTTNKNSEDFDTSDLYLRHTSNFANLLQRYTFEKNSPTSFSVSTSNKQKWENVMKNTSFMIFENLKNFANGLIKADKLLPYLQNSFNNYLKYNPLFDHNHTTGEVSVNDTLLKTSDEDFYADHQETYFENRQSNYDKPPVPFSKESPRDWINRNFLAMFMLPINETQTAGRGSERAGLGYFQQKFQPESAPNVSVVKMGVHSAESLQNSIAMMIIQEAYMNHLSGGSIRGNIVKNNKKSLLPGLQGRSYFIENGQNIFFDEAGNLNSEFGRIVNGKIYLVKNNARLNGLIETVLTNLDSSLDEFVDLALTEKATLDGSQMAAMYDKIAASYLDRYRLSDAEKTSLRGVFVDAKTDIEEFNKNANYAERRSALKKVLSAYYLNSYVNGFFMNQLSSGATQNYKNPLDEIKRQAGVNAMNDTGLIDNKHGMSTSYKNVVIAAANNFYGKSHRFAKIPLLQRFFANKEQEVGDAQSWDLPDFKTMLRKSFGKSVDIGVITKDVHFEINKDGHVDYRKTSSAELTNELVQKNKTLRDLRFAMTFASYLKSLPDEERQAMTDRVTYLYNKMIEGANRSNNFDGLLDSLDEYMEYQDILKDIQDKNMMIHKASFESAIKGSKPSKMSQFIKNNETGTFDFQLEDDSILELNSAYTGIQQAIRHKYIDSFISHFTQLTYLIGLNRTETSIKNNKIITRALSRFAKSGIFDSLFDYKMAYSDEGVMKANLRSKKEFIKDLVKKLDLPGNERIVSLLNTPKISMNNPLFSEKLMQTFFNSFSKKTVAPKHPGGSFVLQSEFGFEANRIMTENSMRIPELVTDTDGNILHAECYLPEMYSDQIKAGEMVYYNSDQYSKMFGFRIPSSDLHSSVPLKVIGYYPSSMQDNVVVIPSAVTALHGSDFDVDKLFVVRYGVFGQDDEDVDPKAIPSNEPENVRREYRTRFQTNNSVIAQKGVKYGYTAPDATYNAQGNLTGFGPNDRHTQIFNLEGVLLDEKTATEKRIIQLEQQMVEGDKVPATTRFQKSEKQRARRALMTEVEGLIKHLKTLRTVQKGLYSNTILDAVLDNISYSGENASDILFGITFDPVKGYEETSEYSQLARVFSDINRAAGKEDVVRERPTSYPNLESAEQDNPELFRKKKDILENNLGVDSNTQEGREDLLALINQDIESSWISDRDEFIKRQSPTVNNINKVEQHARIHKDTYMAAGLVGLIANFSKGLAYAFHGITDGNNHISLDIPENQMIELDGVKIDKLTLSNRDSIKNQELRSLVLNAAIDHVKEQILNVLNVGNKTAKMFLAAISTDLTLHQSSMIMLQPVAKELNSSNATTVAATLKKMQLAITEKLNEIQRPLNQTEVDELKVTTRDLERHIQTNFNAMIADTGSSNYRANLLLQYKVIQQLNTLNQIGNEISEISQTLSVIQGLPYSLENAYDKIKSLDKFINVESFFNKLNYEERSEYTAPGFKDDLRSDKNILANVNLANNENVLAALEAIKTQIDVASEMFTENSVQAQFLVNNMIKAISDNSDPSTMFTGEYDQNLNFNTVRDMSVQEKYLKGKNTFNMFKMISRNIFNYLTSGLNISYNNDNHLFSLSIANQKLLTIRDKEDQEFTLGTVRSYIESFLMREKYFYDNTKNYNGNDFIVSQINPEWRLKPLGLIKAQNPDNKFLKGIGIDTNFRDKVRIMTFNGSLVNTAENLAEVEQATHELNNLNNIYVRLNKKGKWEDVPASLHPETPEMNEITFNILKSSLYIDKFKFGMTKATNVIPPIYFQKIFQSLETLVKDLIYYQKSEQGNKYYKDFRDLNNQGNTRSALSDLKENLFMNTIFSVPTVLPNLRSVIPSKDGWKHVNRQAGILHNGNIYDMYLDANILDKQAQVDETQAETTIQASEALSEENTNQEVDQDLSESQAESDLFEKFRKNPSFVVDESPRRPGSFEVYMKVGTTGTKEANNLKYYYKKIGRVNGKLTNNSFDLNLLLNHYQIRDYFNPKRLSIPVKDSDFSGNRVSLHNITISTFLVNAYDDARTEAQNREAIENAINQQIEYLQTLPENANKSVQQIRNETRSKLNVENVLNQINEVSLYDSRNMDRIGLKHFKVLSRAISSDRRTVSFELEALPQNQQITYNKFDAPLEVLKTVKKSGLSKEEKIAYINSIPGVKNITSLAADQMTDAQIDVEFDRATEIDESKEIDKVLKDKSCN